MLIDIQKELSGCQWSWRQNTKPILIKIRGHL